MVRSPLSRVGRIAAREVAGLVRRLKTPRTGTARILYYHRVEDEEHRSCVKPAAFAAQMAHLRTEGYRVLALPEVIGDVAAVHLLKGLEVHLCDPILTDESSQEILDQPGLAEEQLV